VGLINAITVDADNNLISGYRRLMATKLLGRDEIRVHVVSTLGDEQLALMMERDENVERVDMSPADLAAYAVRLDSLLRPQSEARRHHADEAGNVRVVKRNHSDKDDKERTRTAIGRRMGVGENVAEEYLRIGRNQASDDPVRKEQAAKAIKEIESGKGVVNASRRMAQRINKDTGVRNNLTPGESRARVNLVQTKFQVRTMDSLAGQAEALAGLMEHITDKVVHLNKDITDEQRLAYRRALLKLRRMVEKTLPIIKREDE
jgi:ParB-like chromosome segregation protein Spo0J